jgi:hypothetical protein
VFSALYMPLRISPSMPCVAPERGKVPQGCGSIYFRAIQTTSFTTGSYTWFSASDRSFWPSSLDLRGFVPKPPRRHARRFDRLTVLSGAWGLTPFRASACGVCPRPNRDGHRRGRRSQSPEQYVDRLRGEPARRQACRSGMSEVAVEAFVNNAG